jgi:hypothetical protein
MKRDPGSWKYNWAILPLGHKYGELALQVDVECKAYDLAL